MAKKPAPKAPAKVAAARPEKSTPRPTKAEARPLTAEAIDRGGSADFRQIAHQVAGQAVMALFLDVPIEQIRVRGGPDGEAIGGVARGEPCSGEFAFYPTDREGHPCSGSPGDTRPFGMFQPWLNRCPDARNALEAEILIALAPVVAGLRYHAPEAGFPDLEFQVRVDLGFVPVACEGVWDRATPVLVRIRELATRLCGTEDERVKFLDWMIARAINIVTLPVHWEAVLAVAATLLDRHELTGEEVGQIIDAAITAGVVSTPDEMGRGC
jgi:hypothetical protein